MSGVERLSGLSFPSVLRKPIPGERFIQTALREWAYAKHWTDSERRDASLKPWSDFYNHQRPHGSLGYKPPISRADNGTMS